MNNSSVLADLRDIHLPLPISIWPLAPGWYILAAPYQPHSPTATDELFYLVQHWIERQL